jgi:hypothetical protein
MEEMASVAVSMAMEEKQQTNMEEGLLHTK